MQEYTNIQNQKLITEIRKEMQIERNYIERLIIEQNGHLMKNGMNAIMDLNSKIGRQKANSPDRRGKKEYNDD